jgi:signal transduction histidine kinase
VKAVAERHGGSVEVSTGITGGARFTVRLPTAPAADAELDAPPPDPAERVE